MKVHRTHLLRLLISLGSTNIEGYSNEELLEDVLTHPPTHLSNETQKAMVESLLAAKTKGEAIEVIGEAETVKTSLPPQVTSTPPEPVAASAPPAPPPTTVPVKKPKDKPPKAPPKPKEKPVPKQEKNDNGGQPGIPGVPASDTSTAVGLGNTVVGGVVATPQRSESPAGNGVGVQQRTKTDSPAADKAKRRSKPVSGGAEKGKGGSGQARPAAKPKAPQAKKKPEPAAEKAWSQLTREEKTEQRNKAIANRRAAIEKAAKEKKHAKNESSNKAGHSVSNSRGNGGTGKRSAGRSERVSKKNVLRVSGKRRDEPRAEKDKGKSVRRSEEKTKPTKESVLKNLKQGKPAFLPEKKQRKLPKTKNGKVIGRTLHRNKGKGPGIIAKMVSILEKAGPKSAISKEHMLEKLTKAFPDRNPKSMRCTISQQLPTKIRGAGHDIRKNEFGYWIK